LLLSHVSKVTRRSVLPPIVIGDSGRLQQVLINLIRNAIDNSFNDGQVFITINYDYKENQLIGIITDRGVGIKKNDQKNIFNLMHLPVKQSLH
jgi:signal transduction histidine kinase